MFLELFDGTLEEFGTLTETSDDTNATCELITLDSLITDARDSPALVTAAASLGPAATFILVFL